MTQNLIRILDRRGATSAVDLHSRRLHAVVFLLLIGWSVGLLFVRVVGTGTGHFLFLVWNLFLATLPWLAAQLLRSLESVAPEDFGRRGGILLSIVRAATLCFWLLFLPNAPYIVTDFVHLRGDGGLLFWYDVILLFSAATTGLMLGFASLRDVQQVITTHRSSRVGWIAALSALLLSGFGIYLGRVLRFNSWDLLFEPMTLAGSLFEHLLDPIGHAYGWGMTLIFGALLIALYLPLHLLLAAAARQQKPDTREGMADRH